MLVLGLTAVPRAVRLLAVGGLAGLVVAVCAGLVVRGYHYPTDTLGALGVAVAVVLGVGLAVGAALLLAGPIRPLALTLGILGVVAIAQGVRGADALWIGMLVAAVSWTAAWALSTG